MFWRFTSNELPGKRNLDYFAAVVVVVVVFYNVHKICNHSLFVFLNHPLPIILLFLAFVGGKNVEDSF